MTIPAQIEIFNAAIAYIQASTKDIDIEKLSTQKKFFYKQLENLQQSAVAIINAKQDEITYLQRAHSLTTEQSYNILKRQFNNLLMLAASRGIDTDLIRYID